MQKILKILSMVTLIHLVVACDPSHSPAPTPAMGDPTQEGDAQTEGGTIVGNGGDDVPMRFTLHALKSFDYWNQKKKVQYEAYSSCLKALRDSDDKANPWTEEEWQVLKFEKCGQEPLPRVGFFEKANVTLKSTKLFLSEKIECKSSSLCGTSWQSFPEERKLYLSPAAWSALSDLDKIRESLLAYLSLMEPFAEGTPDQNLVAEIQRKVFQVDFSMDTFREFVELRKMRIIEEGSATMSQPELIAHMSMAMDCIRLVEKRFPNQVDIAEISLVEMGGSFTYHPGESNSYLSPGVGSARVDFGYEMFVVDGESANFRRQYGIRTTPKKLFLGRTSTLQKCYNSVVALGLKNPLLNESPPVPPQKTQLQLPTTGSSDLSIDFVNISLKSLEYIISQQEEVDARYRRCIQEVRPADPKDCSPPLISVEQLVKLKEIFPAIVIQETDQKLCATDRPDCTDPESLTLINIPSESKIILNRQKWSALDTETKIRLALHEIFGLAGLEANEYSLSARFAPLVHTEVFHVDFMADELRSFLLGRNIFIRFIGDSYDQNQFQERATTLMDCLTLVEQRFPQRLDLGMISLRKEDKYSEFKIAKNATEKILNIDAYYELAPDYTHLFNLGKHVLYLDELTSLQQCYNKVVALGLKE